MKILSTTLCLKVSAKIQSIPMEGSFCHLLFRFLDLVDYGTGNCPKCGDKVTTSKGLQKHIKTFHPSDHRAAPCIKRRKTEETVDELVEGMIIDSDSEECSYELSDELFINEEVDDDDDDDHDDHDDDDNENENDDEEASEVEYLESPQVQQTQHQQEQNEQQQHQESQHQQQKHQQKQHQQQQYEESRHQQQQHQQKQHQQNQHQQQQNQQQRHQQPQQQQSQTFGDFKHSYLLDVPFFSGILQDLWKHKYVENVPQKTANDFASKIMKRVELIHDFKNQMQDFQEVLS